MQSGGAGTHNNHRAIPGLWLCSHLGFRVHKLQDGMGASTLCHEPGGRSPLHGIHPLAFYKALHTYLCSLPGKGIETQRHGMAHPGHTTLTSSEPPRSPFPAELGISDPIPTE